MVALGRPGAGEELLASWGFEGVRRVEVPFAWEFADPEAYARALSSTGPAYEAIQSVGEEAFTAYAVGLARERVRAGLPLRAEIKVVGYVARKPAAPLGARSFLPEPEVTAAVEALYAEDVDGLGYVMNSTRLWGRIPEASAELFGLLDTVTDAGGLSFRHRAVLVTACASTLGDSYCSLAWGGKLAAKTDADLAAAILRGDDSGLDPAERRLRPGRDGWRVTPTRQRRPTSVRSATPASTTGRSWPSRSTPRPGSRSRRSTTRSAPGRTVPGRRPPGAGPGGRHLRSAGRDVSVARNLAPAVNRGGGAAP